MNVVKYFFRSKKEAKATPTTSSQTGNNSKQHETSIINKNLQSPIPTENVHLKNENVSSANENVHFEHFLEDVDDAIQYLSSWEDWLGNEPWLLTLIKELYPRYRNLRSDIRKNGNSWSYEEYCERLAYFYFNLACFFNKKLFHAHTIDLGSIKIYLQNCRKLISKVRYMDDLKDLRKDTENFLSDVNKFFLYQPYHGEPAITHKDHSLIVLGNFDRDSLNQLSDDRKRITLQNIQLLRIINTLEAAITSPMNKISYQTAIYCSCLGQAYKLAGEFNLSAMYASIAQDIASEWKNFTPEVCENQEEKIKNIIENYLKNDKSHLNDIISLIEEAFCRIVDPTDLVFIENIYMEICSNLWMKEVKNTLTKLLEDKKKEVIREIFNTLSSIQSLTDIPTPFCHLEFYELLKENCNLLAKDQERNLLIDFKRECSEKVIACTENAKYELKLLEALANFLNKHQFLESAIADLELEEFCDETVSEKQLMEKILELDGNANDKDLKVLKNSVKCLNINQELFFGRELKKFVKDYLKPVELCEKNIDNRIVIEVKANNINVSTMLYKIEEKMSRNPDIIEVRFIATDIVHLDKSFENKTWHGKNIVIKTKKLKVYENVTCDVSGEDSNHAYKNNAGTDSDGDGKNGDDGYAGKSGGNVLILTEHIENPENLIIISNGGKGSNGQDGGNGTNGTDGEGILKTDFDKDFPPFNSIWKVNSTMKKVKNTEENMKKNAKTFDSKNCKSWGLVIGHFRHAETKEGFDITFCNYSDISSYLLHKGSLGSSGGDGGESGLGGEGGYYGEIKVKNPATQETFPIKITAKDGKNGKDGKPGLHGKHGVVGWDMGYTDKNLADTQCFGGGQSSKLKLTYYSSKVDGSVWCPHEKKYAFITDKKIDYQKYKTQEERKNTRKNTDRKQHAKAKRTKTISEQTVLNQYAEFGHSIDTEMVQNLQSDLENLRERALEAISENQKQEVRITAEVNIRRQVHFSQEDRRETNEDDSDRMSSEQSTDFDRVAQNLTDPSALMIDWPRLKSLPLNLYQLNKINQAFERERKTQANSNTSTMSSIENVLKQKYLFATLQEISTKITFPNKGIPQRLTSVQAERYLIESNEQDKTFSHPKLGRLSQYLFDDNKKLRTQLIEFCKKEFEKERCDDFLESIKSFVLEVGNKNTTLKIIKDYYIVYEAFNVNVVFDVFKSELTHPRNAHFYELWTRTIEDKSLEEQFENEIKEKDIFLYKLYKRYKKQKREPYYWGPCFEDENIRKVYYKHMEEHGLMSGAYWDLLAYTFEVNIRLYVLDQDKRMMLVDEHCKSERHCIHVLSKGERLIQLKIDKNYLELEEKRLLEDGVYAKILGEVDQFKTINAYQKYFENNKFPAADKYEENDNRKYDEAQLIATIANYFPERTDEIKHRLEKLKFHYTGQKGILINLFRRFVCEERHVSYDEMCHFVNAVLSSCVENAKETNTFAWIVAAYSQRKWTDQLTLLQIENHFRNRFELKSQWQGYLSEIRNKDILLLMSAKLEQSTSVTPECINDILHLLSNIPNEIVAVEGLELSEWPYSLKDKYWANKLRNILDWQENNDDLQEASYYIMSIENTFGADLVEGFLKAISTKKETFIASEFMEILSNFYSEKWNLSDVEINYLRGTTIKKWCQNMQSKFSFSNKDRNISKLVQLIKGNKNTSANIITNLANIERDVNTISNNNYKLISKNIWNFTLDDVTKWASRITKNSINMEKDILAAIDRVIEIKKGFKLRDTQKLTVLSLLTNKLSTLAQVSTGEGKSLIVVAASIIKALRGETVDIVTSSSVLAKRDAAMNTDIYSAFKINVGHNCSEDKAQRRDAYSKNQVIYGDLSNFQRDYLLQEFYGETIMGERQCNIIVDEVDSMLLDKGNNMLYLSHDLEDFDKLESVYIFIWQWINRPSLSLEEVSEILNPAEIKAAVLIDLYGAIDMEDLAKIGSNLKKNQLEIIWNRLVDSRFIKQDGKILIQNEDELTDGKLNSALQPYFISYKDRLQFLFKERIQREKQIHVPNYLRSFIELHLDKWITSAITAMFMQADHDYVVDVDRTGTNPDRHPNIIILDRDTGTDQSNSQWEEGLHQFLQLKHGCKLSLQSLKAVFISNVSFFKLYKKLYGLTGTLGSQCERNLLKKIHDVDFVTIPTAKTKRFHEYVPIICSTSKDWIDAIMMSAKEISAERSVLIICETVNEVKQLQKAFGGRVRQNVHTYTRDYEEFDIAHNAEQGQIIIATNLAGRGTDIKISRGLRQAGGLHVCLTYLPKNLRIEQQAFGRAARSGDKGSGQLIIYNENGLSNSCAKIVDLKKKRDSDELHRISEIKVHYEVQIKTEEKCFREFQYQHQRLKKYLVNKNAPKEFKDILLRSCLDKWAFWLDANAKAVKENKFESLLTSFISKLNTLNNKTEKATLYHPKSFAEIGNAWVEENPVQTINLAKYLAQKKQVNDAINLFNNVIRKEPNFCGAAHYYKAFALTKTSNWSKFEFKKELLEAAKLFEQYIETATYASSVISNMKQTNNKLIKVDSFEEQKTNVCNLYSLFLQSIADIMGHPVSAQSFVNNALNIKEDLAEQLYENLLKHGYLRNPKVKNNITPHELKSICYDYGLEVNVLKKFLSSYEGKETNEKDFQKQFKNNIQLPSREAFWKELLNAKVLSDKVTYVVIEDEKLKQFDSKLLTMFDEQKLEKQLLKFNKDEELMLYEEIISHQEKNKCIYRKEDLLKIIGKDKYKMLQRIGIATKNKKARFNLDKCETLKFTCNNSIVLEDLINRIGITKVEAIKILNVLVERNVIAKENESKYSLKIPFDAIDHIKIPFCPLYEDALRRVLFNCFSYTIYLQMIIQRIKDKNYNLRPFLSIKPHQSLIRELLAMKIFIPSTVNTSQKDVKSLLKKLYNTEPSEFEIFFNNAVQSNQIFKTFFNDFTPLFKNILNTEEKVNNTESTEKKQSKLAQEDVIKLITRILERSGSTLETLDVPDGSLQNIIEVIDISSMSEVYIFILDGLEHIVKLEEKKWTWKMIFNTVIVILMGIAQIAIGVLIELYSVGLMTHVGSSFISEGVGDLFFALGALKSGHFSWGDYWKQKIESVVVSAATAGLAAWFSKGTKVSRFGHKLFGPNLAKGEKMVETCGRNLIKVVGYKKITTEVLKRIGLKIVEGVAYGVSNMAVDSMVSNCFQSLSDQIAATILFDIENKITNHKVMGTLQEAYKTLGGEKAKEMIQILTENSFNEQSSSDFYSSLRQLGGVLSQGLSQAASKKSKINATSGSAMDKFQLISDILFYVERFLTLQNSATILTDFLNDMDKRMRTQLNDADALDEQKELGKDYEKFEKETSAQWIALIRQKMSQIVSTEVVSPVLKQGANRLVGYIGKQIKNAYHSYLEVGNHEKFNKLKRKYRKQKKKAKKLGKKSALKRIKKKYHKRLLGLAKKTRDPILFAKIIRENVPMDMTCVKACIRVVHTLLNQMGDETGTLKFVVKGEDGVSQEFISEQNGTNEKCIEINLHDNHFYVSGSGENFNQSDNDTKNNCLFQALCNDIDALRIIKPSDFRNSIADCIENDQDIRYHLKQGWHRIPIDWGIYGGAIRKKTAIINYDNEKRRENGTFSEDDHIISRFVFTFEVGAVARRICKNRENRENRENSEKKPNIASVNDLIGDGASQFQDRNSRMGLEIHASHLVRCHLSESLLNELDSGKELTNMLGHTQNVHRWVNMRGTVGDNIDQIQYKLVRIAAEIDYNNGLDDGFRMKVRHIKREMISVIKQAISKEEKRRGANSELVKKLKNSIKKINGYKHKDLFDKGEQRYSGNNK